MVSSCMCMWPCAAHSIPAAATSPISSQSISGRSPSPWRSSQALVAPTQPVVTNTVAGMPRWASSGHALVWKSWKPSSNVMTTNRSGSVPPPSSQRRRRSRIVSAR
jgi:hypothetical protein